MVRSLSFEEIKSIYEKHLTSDFHQSEIKPLAQIKRLYENRQYVCFGSFSEEALIAYAFFVPSLDGKFFLLDYFAVVKEYRSKRVGSDFLKKLVSESVSPSCILAEVEDPEYASDENDLLIRKRRISFYLKNGLHQTSIRSRVFTDHYVLMIFGSVSDNSAADALEKFYGILFSPENSDVFR